MLWFAIRLPVCLSVCLSMVLRNGSNFITQPHRIVDGGSLFDTKDVGKNRIHSTADTGDRHKWRKTTNLDSRLMSLSSATTYADNVALPACTPSAVHRAATDKNLPAGPQQQSLSMWSMLGQTDRRTDARQMHRPRSACCSTTNWPHVQNGSTQT